MGGKFGPFPCYLNCTDPVKLPCSGRPKLDLVYQVKDPHPFSIISFFYRFCFFLCHKQILYILVNMFNMVFKISVDLFNRHPHGINRFFTLLFKSDTLLSVQFSGQELLLHQPYPLGNQNQPYPVLCRQQC